MVDFGKIVQKTLAYICTNFNGKLNVLWAIKI